MLIQVIILHCFRTKVMLTWATYDIGVFWSFLLVDANRSHSFIEFNCVHYNLLPFSTSSLEFPPPQFDVSQCVNASLAFSDGMGASLMFTFSIVRMAQWAISRATHKHSWSNPLGLHSRPISLYLLITFVLLAFCISSFLYVSLPLHIPSSSSKYLCIQPLE